MDSLIDGITEEFKISQLEKIPSSFYKANLREKKRERCIPIGSTHMVYWMWQQPIQTTIRNMYRSFSEKCWQYCWHGRKTQASEISYVCESYSYALLRKRWCWKRIFNHQAASRITWKQDGRGYHKCIAKCKGLPCSKRRFWELWVDHRPHF